MTGSDWATFAHSPKLTTSEISNISQEIAQHLEHQGGKKAKKPATPKPRGFAAKTKEELLKLARERKIKVSSSWTKDKIIQALRK